ncbi:MAG: PhzF family phenazine biosynthesis protein [Actinomycetes bacterium]
MATSTDGTLPDQTLAYHVLDVFAAEPFAGNPLAVVLDADALGSAAMQTLAREFGLSETVYPLAVTDAERARGVDYRLRIFTPDVELPFAGHPSVGAAWLMARLGRVRPGRVVQVCGAGDLPLEVAADGGPVELTGGTPTCSDPVDPAAALAAVGLSPEDLVDPSSRPARVCGTGLPYTILDVRPEALARCVPDYAGLAAFAGPDSPASGIYVVAWDAGARTARARMFAGDLGSSTEDPATGSAALGYGVWLAASGLAGATGDGTPANTAYTVHQGVEMGRPSLLSCRVEVASGQAVRVRVAGEVVPVAQGRVSVPQQP